MAQPSNKPLKQNPFITMRDPATGRWLVMNHPNNMGEGLQTNRLSTDNTSIIPRDVSLLS